MELVRQHEPTRLVTGSEHIDVETIVFGLGVTGLSIARFLAARGQDFLVIDTRERPPEYEAFAAEFGTDRCRLGTLDARLLRSCGRLIVSPGVAPNEPLMQAARRQDIEILGDIELFCRYARAPIIAITGSNGKSTVVKLVTEIINADGSKARCGGNIGVPALELLNDEEPDFYVLELSSFQLELVAHLDATVACILNISPDHMDRYADFAGYAQAKCRIYEHAGHVVLNIDDPFLAALRPDTALVRIGTRSDPTSTGPAPDYALRPLDDGWWLEMPDGERIDGHEIAVRGKHNLMNALAAIAITDLLGASRGAQRSVLQTFNGLPHRTQLVASQDGIDWIDDSKGTNVGATAAAIDGLLGNNDGILIAGGVGKGADFAAMRDTLEGRVREVVLFGRDAGLLADAFAGAARIHRASSLIEAVGLARRLARRGDTVLFSPACASFDMFEDFNQRGDAFQRAVAEVLAS